jgi:long-subunit acyl-CoA synthetase (AMP-forming)
MEVGTGHPSDDIQIGLKGYDIENQSIIVFQAYRQKLGELQAHRKTFILDKLVFKKIGDLFGGNVQIVFAGGSAVNQHVQQLFHTCIAPVRQAYGSTETAGAGTVQCDFDVAESNTVGSLMEHCQMRLVDWNEGLLLKPLSTI